jgi:hypothetical protein
MSECCNGPQCSTDTTGLCPLCGEKGKRVGRITPENLLCEEQAAKLIQADYYFCPTPSCDGVYFSQNGDQHFTKKDVKTRVGLKENDDPIPVCYCFDFTRDKILDDIRQSGTSHASTYITEKVQASECACEIKNPSGRCCLGEINSTVKEGLRLYGQTASLKV